MTDKWAQHKVATPGHQVVGQWFVVYGNINLHNVECLRYLCWVWTHDDSNILATQRNINKVQGTCSWVSKILTCQEVPEPVYNMFYQVVVAVVFLFWSESWVLSP